MLLGSWERLLERNALYKAQPKCWHQSFVHCQHCTSILSSRLTWDPLELRALWLYRLMDGVELL